MTTFEAPCQAAERLRILARDGGMAAYGKEFFPMEVGRDRHVVIEAYLALTDPTPLSNEWLDSVGRVNGRFTIPGGADLEMYCTYEGRCWSCSIEIEYRGWGGCSHSIGLPEPANRGEARELFRRLGIQTKEEP